MIQQFLSELRQFLPSERVYTDELRTLGWGTDASFYRQIPQVVIRSDGEEEISKIVQLCQKYKLPFTFRAAGTSLSGQSCTDSVLIVAGKHWEKYEIGENQDTIKLQPGIVGGRVNDILKPYGRVFPPDPASIGSAMVGGIVINNASGMNCGVHANSDRMIIDAACGLLLAAYRAGGKVLVCGNGGSAADAEHIVGELMKKFRKHRPIPKEVESKLRPEIASKLEGALPAISLVSMSGITTAVANDVAWETAFAQQVLGLARPGDVLIALSTSGNSANCVAAAEVMKAMGGTAIAFTGARESKLSRICDVSVRVPETETYKVQELHLPVYHALCAAIEEEMF